MALLNFEWTGGQKRSNVTKPLLEIERVSVRLGQRLVLENVSLTICEGERVRVDGPNGSGKSTLLNAIMGVVPLSAGAIRFLGNDLELLSTHERAKRGISYMRQRNNIFTGLTVTENLTLALGVGGYRRFRDRFPKWSEDISPNKQAGMLSGGQKQKLAWGMTVLQNARLTLLDEPIAGMAEAAVDFPFVTTIMIQHS